MERSRLELRVGLFVFVAIVILIVFVFKIGNLKSYGVGYPLRFIFGHVSGVKSGSPIRFCGVDVGEVSRVRFIEGVLGSKTQVEVVAIIRKSLSIPQGSQAYVNTLGLLGEKYIEIIPPAEFNSFLKPNDTLIGIDPVLMQDWIDEGQQVVKDVQELIHKLKTAEGTIGKLLYDDRLYQELEALIIDLRQNPWKLFWKAKEKKRP